MLKNFGIKIFSDGADLTTITKLAENPAVKGFTTNPTLMRKAGVTNYEAFAKEALTITGSKPISFEIFTDDISEMKDQATKISKWGEHVSVKIPVVNTQGHSTASVIKDLSSEGIIVNVTAVFSEQQIIKTIDAIHPDCNAIISIFAGRISDSSRYACEIVSKAIELASHKPKIEILWASTREIYNITEANNIGCHIITVPPEMIIKAENNFHKDLRQYSIETVQMFYDDARASGFEI